MSTKGLVAAAVIVGAIGVATYTFTHPSRPAPGSGPARERGAVAQARPAEKASVPKPATTPAIGPVVAPTVEPTPTRPGTLALREATGSDPADRGLPSQIVLGEVLGPNNSYRDDVFGISATFPEGWAVRGAVRWGEGNRKNTVDLDAGTGISPSMYYQLLPAGEGPLRNSEPEAYFRDIAVRKEELRVAQVPDYRNVPESFEFGRINGAPAMSYFATYTRGDKVMTEYFVRVLGPQSYVMFFTTGELEAVRPAMPKIQEMAKSLRIP